MKKFISIVKEVAIVASIGLLIGITVFGLKKYDSIMTTYNFVKTAEKLEHNYDNIYKSLSFLISKQ